MARDPGDEILRRVAREARSDAVPDLDWDALEARLMRRVRTEKVESASFEWRPLALLGLATAGALSIAALWMRRPEVPSVVDRPAPQAQAEPRREGDKLALGSVVGAQGSSVRVSHPGRVHWTLAPHSSARLLERAEKVLIRLESGAVQAQVAKGLGDESFAVEVGDAKVSVQGTIFKVELRGDRFRVAVTEGIVAVGPRGSTVAPSFVLEAGAQGDFALDGRTGHVNKSEPPALAQRAPRAKGAPVVRDDRAPASPEPPASAAAGELPAEPSIADIESGIMELVNVAGSCFTRHTEPGDGVEVTVRTAASLEIGPDGFIHEIEFSPPLAPTVEACTEAGIRQVNFARSTGGAKVTRLLELKR